MTVNAGTVGVRELRQNLSVYLTRVKAGEAFTVTEHGIVVAELRPLSADADPLARLVSAGRVVAPRRTGATLPRPLRLRLARPVSALLEELRGDAV